MVLGTLQANPALPPPSITFHAEPDKQIKFSAASPPTRYASGDWPLLRIGEATLRMPPGKPVTIEMGGSILTAAKMDYRITVWLLGSDSKELAHGSVVERIEREELGHPLTLIRKWAVNLGIVHPGVRPKTVRIRIENEPANP
jgi:hypothetical protein